MFEKQIEQWKEMDPKWKTIFGVLCIAGPAVIFMQHQKNQKTEAAAEERRIEKAAAEPKKPGESYTFSSIPTTPRNQGLEDVTLQLEALKQELDRVKSQGASASGSGAFGRTSDLPPNAPTPIDLNAPLTRPVNAGAPSASPTLDLGALDNKMPKQAQGKDYVDTIDLPARPAQKIWPSEKIAEESKKADPKLVIPINSGIEGVLLTGVNARPSGAVAGAAGSSNSAINVGAPFVTKLKGDAILPNGWKLNDLGDCFLGGSAIAVLSAERAFAIADTISCVAANGDILEAPVKAYGVDADGIQGLSGKVVSKQGAILAQAFLTGIVSGLGTALTPTALPSFNQSATGGTQSYQYPDPSVVARTAVGTGISNASSQISRFYLEFAKETFPVIEVLAGTRITWILKESMEFKRVKAGSGAKP
jgi:conjugal transfer pilus assembly protein TraB